MARGLRGTLRYFLLSILVLTLALVPDVLAAPTTYMQTFRRVKFENLLKDANELYRLVLATESDFTSNIRTGYKLKESKTIFFQNSYRLNLTEKEQFTNQIKTLRYFRSPLGEALKELRLPAGRTSQEFQDVRFIRYKTKNMFRTISYVARYLGYSHPKFNTTKLEKASQQLFPTRSLTTTKSGKPTIGSLGNRIVSLLKCYRDHLIALVQFYYAKSVHGEALMSVRK